MQDPYELRIRSLAVNHMNISKFMLSLLSMKKCKDGLRLLSYIMYTFLGNLSFIIIVTIGVILLQCQWSNSERYQHTLKGPLIARFMRPTWGPSGADRTQVGPMFASWTLLSGVVYWFHPVSPPFCPSILPSICGGNGIHSISSRILAGSISLLHILSTNFRKCVMCWVI